MTDRPGSLWPAVVRVLRSPVRGTIRTGRAVTTLWRRSLQLRVVAGTLVLSGVVVLVVGWILFRQMSDGLLHAKLASSQSEASAGLREAQETIDAAEPTSDPSELPSQLARDMARRGQVAQLYDLVLTVHPPANDPRGVQSGRASPTIRASSVPDKLAADVSADRLSYAYTLIHRTSGAVTPGLVVGSELTEPNSGATLKVYYVFDLTQQQETLGLLQRSLVAVGVLLVALLGVVAWFVTRQAVTPVRVARQTAERLAAGLLDERMRVRGEDDLARLATSFNQMAASLQRQIRQLEELSRVQQRFVSDVSHELRTPLTTVRMAADVLYEARERFDTGTARSAELLQTELDRFESLLSDLLEISRFDAGAAVLDLEDIDLRTLTKNVVEGSRTLASRKGGRLVLKMADTPCMAEIDTRRIERVVRNLVGNAIEYGEGRDIAVQVASDGHATAVSVRDHGIGLKPGESAMVFERFWRADPARARTTGGTGLGLAISMEDVLLHGGWLQAWGEAGKGAHFRLTMPRHTSQTLDHSPIPLVPDDIRQRPLDIRLEVTGAGQDRGGGS